MLNKSARNVLFNGTAGLRLYIDDANAKIGYTGTYAMKIPYAARFASVAFVAATLYTWFQMRPGLPNANGLLARQTWLLNASFAWSLGWWLWLLAIFSWMVLLVVLMWSYLPAHRVAGMLQSGLMVIAAVLAITAVVVWMGVLPAAFAQDDALGDISLLVDALAISLLNAGCFMGGGVTAWIGWDLVRQNVLSRIWLWCAVLAGLWLLPVPFLTLHAYLLPTSCCFWLVWCLWLSTRQRLPSAFAEWP